MLKKILSSLNSKLVLFIVNFIFGLIFISILFLFEKTSMVEELYNSQLDGFVNRTKDSNVDNGNLAFYNLNESFFQEYNATDSSITPRDGLADVIDKVVEQNPKVVFLDIFLNNNRELDNNLTNRLKNILQDKNNTTRFIFLVKKYMNAKGEDKVKYPYFRKEIEQFEGKTVFYGVSDFHSYGDTAIKRYFDFNKTINKTQFYNIPLLSEILMEDRQDILNEKNITKITINNHVIDLSEKDKLINNRINFYFFKGWREKVSKNNSNVQTPSEVLLDQNYTNKLVYIGVSLPIMGDVHKTALGKMSGIFLLGNAYLTLNNPIEKAPKWVTWSFLLIIILLMSYLLTIFDSILTMIIMSVLVAIVLYSLSSWLYVTQGIFISLFIPLFYISKHGDFAEVLESVVQKGLSWMEYKLQKRKKND